MSLIPDEGGQEALGLLSSPFGGGGFPSITGGHAGPSSAGASSNDSVAFGNSFTVAGQGGTATASPVTKQSSSASMLLIGLLGLAVVLSMRK